MHLVLKTNRVGLLVEVQKKAASVPHDFRALYGAQRFSGEIPDSLLRRGPISI